MNYYMFDFREIKPEDKDWINEKLAISDFRGCEYSFANNLAWRRLNNTLITSYGDFYISCSFYDGQPVITFPTGVVCDEQGREKNIKLFSELKKYVSDMGKPLIVSSVNSDNLVWLKEYYGSKIKIDADRDGFDYIYSAQALAELKGKKYHGKRNHIKRFKENNWSFEPLTCEHFDECTAFAAEFYNNNESY
ncbi:MAG: phosphatidylglycerol lysyltransferase domain-containing protein, partial [Oscillospiraceae bacterium]